MNIEPTDEQAAAYECGEAVTITKPIKKWEPKIRSYEQLILDKPESHSHRRMFMYRAEFAPMWEVTPDAQGWFYNLYNHLGSWYVNQTTAPDLGTVCFPEQEAEILAAKLNSGEVVF